MLGAPNEKPTGLPRLPLAGANGDALDPKPNENAGFAEGDVSDPVGAAGVGVDEGEEKRLEEPNVEGDVPKKEDKGLLSVLLAASTAELAVGHPLLADGAPKENPDLVVLLSSVPALNDDGLSKEKADLAVLLSSELVVDVVGAPNENADLVSLSVLGAAGGAPNENADLDPNENADLAGLSVVVVVVEGVVVGVVEVAAADELDAEGGRNGAKVGGALGAVSFGAGAGVDAEGKGENANELGTAGGFGISEGAEEAGAEPLTLFNALAAGCGAAVRLFSMEARWSLYCLKIEDKSTKGSAWTAFLHASMIETFRPRSFE